MPAPFKLIMISAMYENGGNTTHRMLDGHPELFAYPYESQLGTSLVSDYMTSYVPFKYRWPEFPLASSGPVEWEARLPPQSLVCRYGFPGSATWLAQLQRERQIGHLRTRYWHSAD